MADKQKKKKMSVEKKLAFKFKGKWKRKCRFCGSARALIRKYGLLTCRRCFREVAERIGFRKY